LPSNTDFDVLKQLVQRHDSLYAPHQYAEITALSRKKFVVETVRNSPTTHHGGAGGQRMYSSYSFTPPALDGGEWSASLLGRALPPGKGPPGTHCTGGWVGPRDGLDTEARGKVRSSSL
jgi:hypothetical protein